MCDCRRCYYLMQGEESPTREDHCGWLGDLDPNGPRCGFKPVQVYRGLVLTRSFRVVPLERLVEENEAFSEVIGRGGHQRF